MLGRQKNGKLNSRIWAETLERVDTPCFCGSENWLKRIAYRISASRTPQIFSPTWKDFWRKCFRNRSHLSVSPVIPQCSAEGFVATLGAVWWWYVIGVGKPILPQLLVNLILPSGGQNPFCMSKRTEGDRNTVNTVRPLAQFQLLLCCQRSCADSSTDFRFLVLCPHS